VFLNVVLIVLLTLSIYVNFVCINRLLRQAGQPPITLPAFRSGVETVGESFNDEARKRRLFSVGVDG
jgi:hypothetical protein